MGSFVITLGGGIRWVLILNVRLTTHSAKECGFSLKTVFTVEDFVVRFWDLKNVVYLLKVTFCALII